ncbi:MAG: hypothetical protein ACRDL9_01715 [Trebonia sp.]
MDVTAGDEEVAGTGLDEPERRAEVLDLPRVRRRGDQHRELPRRVEADDVGEQADAVSHRNRDVIVLTHSIVRGRQCTVVAAGGLDAVELTLTGIDPGNLACHDPSNLIAR